MPRILIAGCGFLGEAAALLFLKAGWDVLGLTHTPESAEALVQRGVPAAVADLSDTNSIGGLSVRAGSFDVVVHAASSGRGGEDAYRAIYRDGILHLVKSFPEAFVIFTSSTSVYAQVDGGVVSENSAAEPDRGTGKLLLEAEAIALEAGGAVARLAGIYGPGRSVLLRKFLDGSARIEGDGSRVINQIHRDDAAAALYTIARARMGGVFNVVDNSPATQVEVYGWIATQLNRPLPGTGEADLNRKRGWTNKRVCNAKLRSLGWSPQFPSYKEALTELIAAA